VYPGTGPFGENVFETESPATKKRKLTDEEAYFGEGNSTVTAMNETDDDDDDDDDNDDYKDRVEGSVKRQYLFKGLPGRRIKEELKKERVRHDIWDRRFQKPLSLIQNNLKKVKQLPRSRLPFRRILCPCC
jgi:hypothetical protein